MHLSFWLKLYLFTIPVFFAIDMIWLGYVARNFYKEQLHSLLSPQVNWTAALLFYFIYIVGILIFAVRPGLEAVSLAKACLFGSRSRFGRVELSISSHPAQAGLFSTRPGENPA